MLPGIYEFRWDLSHLVFLGIFWTVVLIIFSTLGYAAVRAYRALRAGQADRLRWHEDFHDLPAPDRSCRHACTGRAPGRVCERAFECAGCTEHTALSAVPVEDAPGPDLPEDRLYDRGHAWARPEEDGTWTVGLDPIASRLVPTDDALVLPPEGARVGERGAAATVAFGGATARILSPIAGQVVGVAPAGADWLLRIRPDESPQVTHLLDAAEARPWLRRELERLHGCVGAWDEGVGPTLCDGGLPDPKAIASLAPSRRDALLGQMFLEP